MRDYVEDPRLSEVLLEESHVLRIDSGAHFVHFTMEFAVTTRHRLYRPPPPTEYLCYHRGRLLFDSGVVSAFDFNPRSRSVDANGEVDFGQIDAMRFDADRYILEGDRGDLDIVANMDVVYESSYRL